MPLLEGDCLGPYTIVAPLGKGGMGEVYRARDTRLNRDVALKVLPQSVSADSERMARFTREAQVLASLNHPNIAQIYGIEESGGTRALVMELVEGRTLDQAIPTGGISMAQFFDVAMALADALHAANQKRITHRDLKPANIMLTEDGRVKVLDFGLARVAEAEPTEPANFDTAATKVALTQAGTIIGTVPYMSPEQIEARPLDHRTDLFSLGVLLYEMATGARPFRGDTSPSLMASILREHPKPVSQVRPDIPAELSQLIGRCLEKDPSTRIQTAQEVLMELRVQRRIYESGSRTSSTGPAAPPSGPRAADMKIAVLPLSCRTAGKEDLADGLTDDIATGLSRFPYLTVAREQGSARYLLEGSLRASGAAVRVSMRLVDSETGTHLWAETYDRQLGGASVFETQDDIATRVVATVADQNGVLVRFMGMALKDRPCEELTASELVLRFFAYIHSFRPEEHDRLLEGFQGALRREPLHALGWACLSGLYSHGYSYDLNPPPDALARMRQAAERAIEIDPLCQDGWRQLAFAHSFAHDLAALRIAAERTISLNPLNTVSVAAAGLILANAGDWERGLEVVRQAIAPNPNHAGWYHHVFFADHYRRGEFEEALAVLKRVNIPGWPRAILGAAAAAGQLGLSGEARAALESLAKDNPALLDPAAARRMWAAWFWDEALVDRFVEGFLKAKALVEGVDPGAKAKPPSGTSRTMATAVVPFTTHNDDPDAKALAGGLTEDITAGLSRFPYLLVAREPQGARYLIEGSVRKSAGTVRVSARLMDKDTGAHMWAETYTRDTQAADLFALQDEIADHIVGTAADMHGVLVRAMGNPLRERPCEDLTIIELILRYQVFTRQFEVSEHARLFAAFENAVEREPSHAEAWACLAMLGDLEYSNSPSEATLGRFRAAAQRAIELDPVCQRGWLTLAFWSFYTRDRSGFSAAAERTISLNPLNTGIVATIGRLRSHAGDWDEGVALSRQAMELNPHHPGWYHLPSFYNCYRQHAYEEALQIAKRFQAQAFNLAAICLAAVVGKLGLRAEAKDALEAIGKLNPALLQPERMRAVLAVNYWDQQLMDELMDGFLKAKALAESEAVKSPSGQLASIAVLPFTDMSEAKDQEWFCDGIAEEILNALTHLKGLNVAARTSAFSFRGKGDDLRTIGEKLQVTTVLEGSVRRSGDRLRITVQLNEVANGYRLWSERYDRELKDIFDVQDEIAKAIAERLRVTLAGGAEARLVAKATENMEAYELYLKGRALLYQRGRSIAPALEKFQKAAELDPGYALAWAGIADAYTVLSYFGFLPGQEGRPQALAAARRAIELDPNSAEAHTSLACATLLQGGDLQTTEREFAQSLAINPSYTQGRAWYALFYLQWACGRLEDGIAEARRALASDPLSAYAKTMMVFCLTTANQPSEAVEIGRSAVQADPASFLARWALALALGECDRFEEAVAVFEEAAEMSARHCFAIGSLARTLSRWGKRSEARALHQELLDRARVEYIPFFQLALTAAAAGEDEQALDLAERAWQEREPGIYLFARHWVDYGWFREQPRFSKILRQLEAL